LIVDLRRRATDPEGLDTGVPETEALASLGDLRFVNRWMGGRASLRTEVQPHLLSSDRPRLLDVGCGSGDVCAFLARAMPRPVQAVGVDLKLLHVRQAPREVQPLVANACALPFRAESFDVVVVSLFLHHFDAPDLPVVLRTLYATCRRALVVTDLRRAHVPYLFGRMFFRWLFRSRVSVEDGLISIRRAFRDDELRDAFVQAGIPHVRIRRVFPYRLLAVAERARPY
jgi:ubiquinone/menaquinone biosynthesis C-methylase UbiE